MIGVIFVVAVVVVGVGAYIAGRMHQSQLDEAGGSQIRTFELCEIYPQVRCPTDDIIVKWAAQGNPVTLSFNGQNQSLSPSGSYRIPATVANSAPQHTTVVIKIDGPNGESRSFDVDTIIGETKFDRKATPTLKDFEFQNEFPKQIWSDSILFLGVELISPQSFQGPGKGSESAEWQYDAGMSQSGTLDRQNNFTEKFPSPVPIDSARTWVFLLANVPKKQSDRNAVKESLDAPKFRVVVKCRG